MAWSYVTGSSATAANGTSATTKPVTLGAAASVGDRIVILVGLDDNPATSVTDNLGTSYSQDAALDGGNPAHVSVWSGTVTSAGTPTVTSHQTTSRGGLQGVIYSGLSTASGSSAIDVQASATGTSGAPGPTATTAATSADNELCVGLYSDAGSTGPPSAGTGYTLHDGGNPFDRYDIEEKDSGTAGSAQSANLTSSAGSGAIQFLIVYKLAGPAAGVGTTPLSVYLTSTADTLASANGAQLSSTAPAAEASNAGAKPGTSTAGNWWEVWAKNQNTTSAGASEPNPSGGGWIWDATTLEGQMTLAGSWTPTIKMSSSGAITVDVHLRAYKRSSGGSYTLIADCTAASVALSTTAAVINPTAASNVAAAYFNSGDKLYVDLVVKIVTAAAQTTRTITVFDNGGANEGFATPGYAGQFPPLNSNRAKSPQFGYLRF